MLQAQTPTLTLPIERWCLAIQLNKPLAVTHLGSALRGAFGTALKALACKCTGTQHANCLYQQIFEPQPPPHWPERFSNCPPAYVITPPTACHQVRQQIEFEFTLLGPCLNHRALIWQAWQSALTQAFTQKQVSAQLQPGATPALYSPASGTEYLSVQLTSPLLLKRKQLGMSRSQALGPTQLQFNDLLLALHRRLSLTQQLYGVPIQLPALLHWLQQAEKLSIKMDLQEAHFQRYSNRQKKSMPLYGVLGHINIQGPLSDDLLSALTLGQWLHIGGKTAFGLGGYRLFESPNAPVNDRKSMQ